MIRKKLIIPVAILLISSLSFQSCIGSFSLTNKVLTWNKNVNNKFVNELVFFVFWVLPVYEVTALADLLVINSIEFWSGNKPLEANNRIIETQEGNYQIFADETGYRIKTPNGELMCFDFDIKTQTWSFNKGGNDKTDFLKFIDDNHIQVIDQSGEFVDVELSDRGVAKFTSSQLFPFMALN